MKSPHNAIFLHAISALSIMFVATMSAAQPVAEPNAGATLAVAKSTVVAPGKKQVFALISAVGDQFTYVKLRQQVGSNIIDNNFRKVMKAPDNGLNLAVLKGMDTAIAAANPDSERVFLSLNPVELEGVLPQNREAVAIGKLISVIEKMPERQNWDKIVIAVPNFLMSERDGMGPKLQGFGLYVQPLVSGSFSGVGGDNNTEVLGNDIDRGTDSDTGTPNGKRSRSKQYVAPFAYMVVYILDAKTLKVLEKNARYDYSKLSDPESTALNIENAMTPEFISARMTRLIERSAAAALGVTDSGGSVVIGDIKRAPTPPAPAPNTPPVLK